ncbi:hypothetical protein Tco_1446587 [Tanacetum coccineum]
MTFLMMSLTINNQELQREDVATLNVEWIALRTVNDLKVIHPGTSSRPSHSPELSVTTKSSPRIWHKSRNGQVLQIVSSSLAEMIQNTRGKDKFLKLNPAVIFRNHLNYENISQGIILPSLISIVLMFTYIVILLPLVIKDVYFGDHDICTYLMGLKSNKVIDYQVRGTNASRMFNAFCAISAMSTLRMPVVNNMRKALHLQFTVGLAFYYGVTIAGYWSYG